MLFLLCGCFFFVLVAGTVFSALDLPGGELRGYLEGYFQAAGSSRLDRAGLWRCVWDVLCWPAGIFLLGFSALGAVLIPPLLCARGFFLSYCVSLLVQWFGLRGLLAALAVFGVSALLVLPALLAVGFAAFRSSLRRRLAPGESVLPWREGAALLVPAAAALAAAILVQQLFMPSLLSAVCARFFVS